MIENRVYVICLFMFGVKRIRKELKVFILKIVGGNENNWNKSLFICNNVYYNVEG